MLLNVLRYRLLLGILALSLLVGGLAVGPTARPSATAGVPAQTALASTLAQPQLQSGEASVTILPIDRAKFLAGQRFDFRVEAQNVTTTPDLWITLINGQFAEDFFGKNPVVTSSAGNTQELTIRDVTFSEPGHYQVTALVRSNGDYGVRTIRYEVVAPDPTVRRADNVILFIGDGLSQPIRTAARIVSRGVTEGRYDSWLAMDDMDYMAAVTTSGMDSIITDSANSASAYATGHKSAVNALGVYPDNSEDPNDDPRVENIIEMIKRSRGMSAGVVTTSEIQDATPAAMFGHTRRRAEKQFLMEHLLENRPEVILGGGGAYFLPQSVPGSKRDDSRDLYDEFESLGYQVVNTRSELMSAGTPDKLLGIFHPGNMEVYLDKAVFRKDSVLKGNTDQPMLWEMTEKALDVLGQNPNGFFLMVEGASIDKQAHPMDWERTVWDTIEFDRAIGVAKEWAKRNGDNTLIIVTADHSHGMSITGTYWEGDGKTGRDGVRTYADAQFPDYVDADGDWFPDDITVSRRLSVHWANHPDFYDDYVVNDEPMSPAVSVDGKYVANEERDGGIGLQPGNLPFSASTAVHTAEDVPLTASGPGAEQFRRPIDNTEVFYAMANALRLDPR